MAEQKTIQSLQAGRALAALAVLAYHANLAARDFSAEHQGVNRFDYGFHGVDFFFVLSGFIIYHSTVGRGRSPRDYGWARFRRVYLPYLPIGIGIAILYVLFPTLSEGNHQWSWLPTLTLLPVSSQPALVVAWTLKHEIFFYVLFGCLYFGGFLAPGLLIWSIAIAGAALVGIPAFVPLAPINLEFVMGVVAAVFYRRGIGHPALLLLALVPAAIWRLFGAERSWSVLVGLSFAIVILPIARMEARNQLKVPAVLTSLGAASYSIYLAHSVAISLTARVLRGNHYWLLFPAVIAAGLAAGLIYHLLVERNLLRIAPGDRRHQRLTGEEQPSAASNC